jgi:hypothetical protein
VGAPSRTYRTNEPPRYAPGVKETGTGRLAQMAGKYAEHAPAATACCMTCRTCITSNLLGLAAVPAVALFAGVRRLIGRDGAISAQHRNAPTA